MLSVQNVSTSAVNLASSSAGEQSRTSRDVMLVSISNDNSHGNCIAVMTQLVAIIFTTGSFRAKSANLGRTGEM